MNAYVNRLKSNCFHCNLRIFMSFIIQVITNVHKQSSIYLNKEDFKT